MRKNSFDEKLDRLREISGGPITDESVDTLRSALNGSQGVLAALAAEIVGVRRIAGLAPDLVKAFNKAMADTDKGCQVKLAAVEALHKLEYYKADDVFLRGIKHVQMEPAFGEFIDTADDLRAACAVALASMRHRQAHYELTNLLVDRELKPRRAAVKGLAHLGGMEAEVVLRLKALVGDKEADVIGECFNGLLSIAPKESMSFVGEFLGRDNLAIAEQAALALGQSHEAEAFEMMHEHWENNFDPEFRRMMLLPISLLRRDDAFAFLLDVVESRGTRLAEEAVTVLGIYADDKSRRKIRDAVKQRNDPQITATFEREFGNF